MPRSIHVATWGQPLFDAILTRSPGVDVEAFKTAYHPAIAEFIADGRLDKIPVENYHALDQLIALGKLEMLAQKRIQSVAEIQEYGNLKFVKQNQMELSRLMASAVG